MTDFTNAQKNYMDGLFTKLAATITDKTTEIRNEFKQQIGELKEEIATIVNTYEDRISKLEEQNQYLQNTVIQLQRKTRKNNLVIFGISSIEPNLHKCIIDIFRNTLEVEISDLEIRDVYRVGPSDKNLQPVIVQFNSYEKKLLVQKNANKLKGKNIAISQDQCYEDRTTHKILIRHLKQARSEGIQAYIKGDKIIIGNETYTADDLEKCGYKQPISTEKNKSDSAPSTPEPQSRQKRLLDEFGSYDEEIHQEHKKTRPAEKIITKIDKTISKQILTRSTALSQSSK